MRRNDLGRIRILICIGYMIAFCFNFSAAMQNVYRVSKQTSKKFSPSISAVLVACPRRSPSGCEPKMMVNLRVGPSGETEKIQKYVVLDEAYDQKRQTRAKLMSPYLIEVTRGEPVLMYPLEFTKSIRCDCEKGVKECSALRQEVEGFSNLKEQAGSKQEQQQLARQPEFHSAEVGSKGDIRTASNENPQEVKDHLTNGCFMNLQDFLEKTRINQAAPQRVVEEKLEKVKDGDGVREETANIENNDSTSSEKDNKSDASGNVPPFLAKIHIGMSNDKQKQKRMQTGNEKNQKLLEEMSQKEQNIKKDVLRSLSTMDFSDSLEKRLTGSYKQPKRCGNCVNCKNGPCSSQCASSGPCSKGCEKCSGAKISQVASNRNEQYERFQDKNYDQQQTGRDDDDENDDDDDEEEDEPAEGERGNDKKLMRKNDLTIQEIVDDSSNSYDRRDSQDDISANDVSKIENALSNNENLDMEGDDWTEDFQQSGGSSPARYRNADLHKYSRYSGEYPRNQRIQQNMMNEAKVNYRQNNGIDNRKQGCLYCNPPGKGKCAQVGRMKIAVSRKDTSSSRLKEGSLNEDIRFPLSKIQSPYVQDKSTNNFPIQRSTPEHNEKSFMHSLPQNKDNGPRDAADGLSFSDRTRAQLCPSKNSEFPHISYGGRSGIVHLKDHKMLQSTINYHPSSDLQPLSASAAGISSLDAPANANEVIDMSHSSYARGPEDADDGLGHPEASAVGVAGNEPNNWGLGGGIYTGSDNNYEGSPENKLYNEGINGNLEEDAKLGESGAAGDLDTVDWNGDDKFKLIPENKPFFYDLTGAGGSILPEVDDNQNNDNDNTLKHDLEKASLTGSSSGVIRQKFAENPNRKESREIFHTISNGGSYIGILPSSEYKMAKQNTFNLDDDIINDPNLETRDKMQLMDVILEPADRSADERYIKVEPELENGFIPYDLSNTDRIPVILNTQLGRRLLKRSYKTANRRNIPQLVSAYRDTDDSRMSNSGGGKKCNSCKGGSCVRDTSCGPCKHAGHCKSGDCKRVLRYGEKKTGACKTGDCGRSAREEKNSGNKRKLRSVSDVWYTVLNTSVPLPFLTTRVRIFRKKENSWWKIAPSITLTSLSGVYANANLSILFSSHVEMFSFDKPLIIKNHRLMLPKEEYEVYDKCMGDNILAVDNYRYNLDNLDPDDVRATKSVCEAAFHRLNSDVEEDEKNYRIKRNDNKGIYAVQDFGYFPTQMNVLQKCPNDSKQLCLNILDTEVPAFSIKIKFPFRDNAVVPHDYFQVRIANIFTDATTPGALLVTIMLVNEALLSHLFTILITNCKITCGGNNKVERLLAPHIGEKITFLLPLQEINSNVKFTCDVVVKSDSGQLVASRQMTVESMNRCICVWHCSCYCVPELASTFVYDACQPLPESKEKAAGFVEKRKFYFDWRYALTIALFLLALLLILGFIKALLGCCCPKVNRWKYDYLQPMGQYEDSSRCYRFFINLIFFLVFPFVCCCKRYTPVGYESHRPSDSGASFVHKPSFQYEPSDDEETILSQHISTPKSSGGRKSAGVENEASVIAPDYFCELYNDDEEEQDTGYVLNALAESRESFKLMDGHQSEELSSADPRGEEAAQFVRELVTAKIVYRSLHQPVGNANVPPGQSYSIRGYFLPAAGPGYQFITHIPLRQHWSICPDINTLRPIIPPIMLFSKEFTRSYAGRLDVLEAGDLSVRPSVNAPCINVLVQDITMYHQPDPDDLNEDP